MLINKGVPEEDDDDRSPSEAIKDTTLRLTCSVWRTADDSSKKRLNQYILATYGTNNLT